MTEDEVARARAFARSLGMTLSNLVRALLRVPESLAREGGSLVIIYRVTAVRLALGDAASGAPLQPGGAPFARHCYYIRANDMDTVDVLEELDQMSVKLTAMQSGIEGLCCEARSISERVIAGIGRCRTVPMPKTIAGHSCARGICCRYPTRKNRALASDYINIDTPGPIHSDEAFDRALVMDSTRRAFGNDPSWCGKRVRACKHYAMSPDLGDGIGPETLRELVTTWVAEHFSEYEVVTVYRDDNEHGIPHVHVVVNNINIETGRRLQDPDPRHLPRRCRT